MKVQQINNQPNFQGYITVNGLNKSQQKVYNGIKNMLEDKVGHLDHTILHINGSISPYMIGSAPHIKPKYVILHTQVKSATKPTASTYIDTLNPNDWLKKTDKVVLAHIESNLYQKAKNGELESFWTKLKNKFSKLFKKGK